MSDIKIYFNDQGDSLEKLKQCPSIYKESNREVIDIGAQTPSIANDATYYPPLSLYFTHVMNYYSTFGVKKLNLKRNRDELILKSDGGTVSLDWFEFEETPTYEANTKTILICHGLTGGSHEPYIQYFAKHANKFGYRSVVFNYRGCAGNKITADVGYCGTKIDDLQEVIEFVQNKLPKETPLFLTGFSLGSVLVANYLRMVGEKSPFLAHLCISNPLDMVACTENLGATYLNKKFYLNQLTNNVKRLFRKFGDRLDKFITKEQLERATTLRQLDVLVTAPMFGYDSPEAYYKDASAERHIHSMVKPILFINAVDDPICPIPSTVYDKFKSNPNTILVQTCSGGHLGFISNQDWLSIADKAGIEYFNTFL